MGLTAHMDLVLGACFCAAMIRAAVLASRPIFSSYWWNSWLRLFFSCWCYIPLRGMVFHNILSSLLSHYVFYFLRHSLAVHPGMPSSDVFMDAPCQWCSSSLFLSLVESQDCGLWVGPTIELSCLDISDIWREEHISSFVQITIQAKYLMTGMVYRLMACVLFLFLNTCATLCRYLAVVDHLASSSWLPLLNTQIHVSFLHIGFRAYWLPYSFRTDNVRPLCHHAITLAQSERLLNVLTVDLGVVFQWVDPLFT